MFGKGLQIRDDFGVIPYETAVRLRGAARFVEEQQLNSVEVDAPSVEVHCHLEFFKKIELGCRVGAQQQRVCAGSESEGRTKFFQTRRRIIFGIVRNEREVGTRLNARAVQV